MHITVKLLKKHKACEEQVALFAATFPNGVQVTEATCLAVADQFDFQWAAGNLLPSGKKADYDAERAPILDKYMDNRASISAKNVRIMAEYDAKHARIRAEYAAERATIRMEYKRQVAALFGRIASTV